MLIDFTFSNFRSYRENTEFSMMADKYTKHKESLMKIPGQRFSKVLPVAAIYGGNASGKSNFIAALKTLRNAVVSGNLSGIEPFLLAAEPQQVPTTFNIRFIVADSVYEYALSVQHHAVVHEALTDITKKAPVTLFERRPSESFASDLFRKMKGDEKIFAEQLGNTIPASELLLTTLVKLRPATFYQAIAPCFSWFLNTLCIIEADSKRIGLGYDILSRLEKYQEALNAADTGIETLRFKSVDAASCVPAAVLEDFRQSNDNFMVSPTDASLVLFKNDKGIEAVRCYSCHTTEDGKEIDFLLNRESDGTRRYMHLLPILLDVLLPHVYVVDELDRSLHHALSLRLVSQFRSLISSGTQQLQLIFTTHDALLMAKDNLRKDEVWVTERSEEHETHLISFADYKDVRADKDILKSYLEGRMGGLPKIYPC